MIFFIIYLASIVFGFIGYGYLNYKFDVDRDKEVLIKDLYPLREISQILIVTFVPVGNSVMSIFFISMSLGSLIYKFIILKLYKLIINLGFPKLIKRIGNIKIK